MSMIKGIPMEPFAVNKDMGRILVRRGGETIAAGESRRNSKRKRRLINAYGPKGLFSRSTTENDVTKCIIQTNETKENDEDVWCIYKIIGYKSSSLDMKSHEKAAMTGRSSVSL